MRNRRERLLIGMTTMFRPTRLIIPCVSLLLLATLVTVPCAQGASDPIYSQLKSRKESLTEATGNADKVRVQVQQAHPGSNDPAALLIEKDMSITMGTHNSVGVARNLISSLRKLPASEKTPDWLYNQLRESLTSGVPPFIRADLRDDLTLILETDVWSHPAGPLWTSVQYLKWKKKGEPPSVPGQFLPLPGVHVTNLRDEKTLNTLDNYLTGVQQQLRKRHQSLQQQAAALAEENNRKTKVEEIENQFQNRAGAEANLMTSVIGLAKYAREKKGSLELLLPKVKASWEKTKEISEKVTQYYFIADVEKVCRDYNEKLQTLLGIPGEIETWKEPLEANYETAKAESDIVCEDPTAEDAQEHLEIAESAAGMANNQANQIDQLARRHEELFPKIQACIAQIQANNQRIQEKDSTLEKLKTLETEANKWAQDAWDSAEQAKTLKEDLKHVFVQLPDIREEAQKINNPDFHEAVAPYLKEIDSIYAEMVPKADKAVNEAWSARDASRLLSDRVSRLTEELDEAKECTISPPSEDLRNELLTASIQAADRARKATEFLNRARQCFASKSKESGEEVQFIVLVQDKDTGEGISGAHVVVTGPKVGIGPTDGTGRFTMEGLRELDVVTITATHSDYKGLIQKGQIEPKPVDTAVLSLTLLTKESRDYELKAWPVPINPKAHQGVIIFVSISRTARGQQRNVPLAGLSVRMSVAGTDGYHNSVTSTTDGAGNVTTPLYVPGANKGVYDVVTVVLLGEGNSVVIKYTFA